MASAAAAALVGAAARRLSRSTTASTMVLREVSGSHKLTIDGFKPSKNFPMGWAWDSKPFAVGGHSWRIRYSPHGYVDGHISLELELDCNSAIDAASDVTFRFSLLDKSGNPVPEFSRATAGPCSFHRPAVRHGFGDFIAWEDLDKSGCLGDDDAFAVRCDVTFTTDLAYAAASPASAAAAVPAPAAAPAPATGGRQEEHLIDLLWKHKRGADVTVDVGGEAAFDAHGWLLAARSPVLEAELLASNKERKSGHRRIEVHGVEPRVFEAMLHYMYTDALPEKTTTEDGDGGDAMAMAQGLLVAADRFKLERLKVTCEEMLARRIDVGTAAGTMAVAEQHGCRALKAACVEFMARPGNLKAVMETEGFDKVKAIISDVVMLEVVMKQAAARLI